MSNIRVIARGASALNLGLTGATVEEVSDVRDAEKRVEDLLQKDEIDLLIIDERLREGFSDVSRERIARYKGDCLIVNCPSFEEEDTDVDAYLSSIIKPAVGFEIRLS